MRNLLGTERGSVVANPACLGEMVLSGLHDLCQPLTAIECRLSIALMKRDDMPRERRRSAVEEVTELRLALEESLAECHRMMVQMRSMQDAACRMVQAEFEL